MKIYHHIFASIIIFFSLISCAEQGNDKSLNETEYYFNERLASISEENDTLCWLGDEYGKVWRVTNSGRQGYKIAFDRIYFVKHLGDDYWIGVRNSGLQRWHFDGSRFTLMHCYPIVGKQLNYSAYDAIEAGGKLFFSTSQGLFVLSGDTATTPQMLYPGAQYARQHEGAPCVVKKMVLQNGSTIIAASNNGVLRVDVRTQKVTITHGGEKIDFVALYDNKLHILAGNRFYVEGNGDSKTYELDFNANVFYRSEGTFCFLNINHALLTKDLKTFTRIRLRREIPVNSCNIVLRDERNGFMLLVTDNALWKVPMHLDVFNTDAPIISACADKGNIYYVNVNNEIFFQKKNTEEAGKVFDFIRESPIVNVYAKDGTLYYLNDERQVKQLALSGQLWRNYLLSRSQECYASKDKVTAFAIEAGEDSVSMLLGVQDGLVRMGLAGGQPDTVAAFSDKYITSFYRPEGSALVYLTTLNDGVFAGKNGSYKAIRGFEHMEGIRGVVVNDEYPASMVVLANDKLVLQGSADSISVTGINKIILANDTTVYGLMDFGLRRFSIRDRRLVETGLFFRDIRFNPNASLAVDNHLYLGCNLGVLHFVPGQENHSSWVEVQHSGVSRRLLAVSFASVIIFLLVSFVGYRRYRHIGIKQIVARKNDLRRRLSELRQVSELLEGDYKNEIEPLETEINGVGPHGKESWKQVNVRLSAVSDTIMRMNRNTALLLMKFVDNQRQEILRTELYDSHRLAELTDAAIQTGLIENIRSQAVENVQWLTTVRNISDRLDKYTADLAGTLPLEGINADLEVMIETFRKELAIKPLAELADRLHDIDKRYNAMFADETLSKLKDYARQRLGQLRSLPNADKVVVAQIAQLESETTDMEHKDRITLLRRMRHVDCRVEQILSRLALAQTMKDYSAVRQQVVNRNEERVNKLFDKKLEAEIAGHTHDLTVRIGKFVERFYANMDFTDHRLLASILQFTSYDNQQAKVLALLIADAKVKRTFIPGMLDMVGNLNPVISRLVKNKIKPNEAAILQYSEHHPSSMAAYILMLT